jgi:hypothetical protein
VALSVPLVLLFGEVLPAAVFSSWSGGDGSTALTARLAPLMWACVAVAGVVTLPLSWAVERCVCCRTCGRGSGTAGGRGSGHNSGGHGTCSLRNTVGTPVSMAPKSTRSALCPLHSPRPPRVQAPRARGFSADSRGRWRGCRRGSAHVGRLAEGVVLVGPRVR